MEGSPRSAARPARLPPAFDEQPRRAQLAAALLGPALLGSVAGIALGLSSPAYWALQALATLGGLVAGLEHTGAGHGARRGLLGGTLFGTFLLVVHALSGLESHADLGEVPAVLVLFTAAIGCALGAVGGRLRQRLTRERSPA